MSLDIGIRKLVDYLRVSMDRMNEHSILTFKMIDLMVECKIRWDRIKILITICLVVLLLWPGESF